MFPREDRIRTPVSGIRQRLRIALRHLGFPGKFKTVHLRRDGGLNQSCLIVIAKSGQTELPMTEFEGMNIYLRQHTIS